jgi:4-amino-4-deoxy-L-arabinose transferase-like glycosyltransferase
VTDRGIAGTVQPRVEEAIGRHLTAVFAVALIIRIIYPIALHSAMGDAGVMGVDSQSYVAEAHRFAASMSAGSVEGWEWLGQHPSIMPLFGLLTAVIHLAFGNNGPLAYVLIQGLLDSGTCIVIYLIAHSIVPRFALAAAIAAAINPTQIMMSGLVYPDTPFVFCVAVMMLGAVRWLQTPSAGSAATIAIGLGCAALCRVLIAPWAAVLLAVLVCGAAVRSRLSRRALVHIAAIAIAFALVVGLIVARNVSRYGSFALTPQGGSHLLFVVPWVKRAHDGTPWAKSHEELKALAERRYPTRTDNPFEESRRVAKVANEMWRPLGLEPTIRAWAYGAVINLVSPAVLLSPPLIQIPRTGFYGTPGSSIAEKVFNFLFRSESMVYTWALLIGAAGLLIVRFVQLAGVLAFLRWSWRLSAPLFPVLVLFALWFLYILAVNGPIASPKYRLPLEPVLNLLTGIGFCSLRRWWQEQRRVDASQDLRPAEVSRFPTQRWRLPSSGKKKLHCGG